MDKFFFGGFWFIIERVSCLTLIRGTTWPIPDHAFTIISILIREWLQIWCFYYMWLYIKDLISLHLAALKLSFKFRNSHHTFPNLTLKFLILSLNSWVNVTIHLNLILALYLKTLQLLINILNLNILHHNSFLHTLYLLFQIEDLLIFGITIKLFSFHFLTQYRDLCLEYLYFLLPFIPTIS